MLSLACGTGGRSWLLGLVLNGNLTFGLDSWGDSGGGGLAGCGECGSRSSTSPSSGDDTVGLFNGRSSSGGWSAVRLVGVEGITAQDSGSCAGRGENGC